MNHSNLRNAQKPKSPVKVSATKSPPEKTNTKPSEEKWRLTQAQIKKELAAWKENSQEPILQALLTEKGIWDIFKQNDKEGYAKGFLGGGVRLAIQAASSGGSAMGLIDAATDTIKEHFLEKGASRVMGYGLRRMEWKEDPEGVLIKKLSTNVLVLGVLVATGASFVTAGISAAVGAVFAIYVYMDRRDAQKYAQMQADIATHMIDTYKNIMAKSLAKVERIRERKFERMLLSSSKDDYQDDHLNVVATYWSAGEQRLRTIHDYDLKQLLDLLPVAGKLDQYYQAHLWLSYRVEIEYALVELFAGRGIDDDFKIEMMNVVEEYLGEQDAELSVGEGNFLSIKPKVSSIPIFQSKMGLKKN